MEYTFEDFAYDVNLGREVEFIYNGIMYFITHEKGEWFLINTVDKTEQCYLSSEDLLSQGTIEDKKISKVWDSVRISTIY